MNELKHLLPFRKRTLVAVLMGALVWLFIGHHYLYSQDKSDFPDGFDAVQAAPDTHKVIFENAFVRVLEATVPPAGKTIPMHHHRWPSFFLSWDTGGKSPHIRYHRADGSVRDDPSKEEPAHPGRWSVQWMNPEPMHAIEVLDRPENSSIVSDLRIEIKCAR
jgi:hypothetical protein